MYSFMFGFYYFTVCFAKLFSDAHSKKFFSVDAIDVPDMQER